MLFLVATMRRIGWRMWDPRTLVSDLGEGERLIIELFSGDGEFNILSISLMNISKLYWGTVKVTRLSLEMDSLEKDAP